MNAPFWTQEELTMLKQMIDKGLLIDDIRKVFTHRSQHAIRIKAKTLGYSMYQATPKPDFEQFKKLMKKLEKPKNV